MNKFLIIATSSLTFAFASSAFASSYERHGGSYGPGDSYGSKKNYSYNKHDDDDDDDHKSYRSRGGKWMSPAKARAKASRLGYKVRRIKRDDGYYEIDAYDKRGRAVELYMHRTSGKVFRVKRKY